MAIRAEHSRRQFLFSGTAAGSGLLIAGIAQAAETLKPSAEKGEAKVAEDISPPEDLMREHGVLNRILLLYEESARRLDRKSDLPTSTVLGAAKVIRTFIEEYHEKLEEDHLFPRFEKAGRLVDLVKVLRDQHQAGRILTEQITKLATPAVLKDDLGSKKLSRSLRRFVRMYRPHEAREDTVLFPAVRSLMTAKEFDQMGDQFEEKEHQMFGEHGFENIVAQVAEFEKTLGIYDLSRFTAKP